MATYTSIPKKLEFGNPDHIRIRNMLMVENKDFPEDRNKKKYKVRFEILNDVEETVVAENEEEAIKLAWDRISIHSFDVDIITKKI